ncbi:MAG: hypothetical protein ABW101_06105 [Candidatus Thiodiazotropha sp.]
MISISINAPYLVRLLTTVAALLILASIIGQVSKYGFHHDSLKGMVSLFYLDEEYNIPTFFTLLLMTFISFFLALKAIINSKTGDPHTSKWIMLSTGFLYMAFDEAFSVHERLTLPFRNLLGGENYGVFYYAWVIPAIILVFILGLVFFRFIVQLHPEIRTRFLIAASIYLTGAIGFELIGGYYAEIHGTQNLAYSFIATVEEGLEILGLITFISALLKHSTQQCKDLRLTFEP